MNEKPIITCDKCEKYGFKFRSFHDIFPIDFIDGDVKAEIWIIGLNPNDEIGHIEPRQLSDIKIFKPNCHSYFRDFKKVSEKLYKNWEGQNSNIAHTDLVKCFSKKFLTTSENNLNNKTQIINNCAEILKEQILRGKPKLIICNGSPVCKEMLKIFRPKQTNNSGKLTSYPADIEDHHFWIVLSGFIGRIDDYNKRRLGIEIDQLIDKEGIDLY